MNKRLTKLHKRQVSRARDRVRLSEPDVRTPEQVKAAREASRPVGGWGRAANAHFSRQSAQDHSAEMSQAAAKTDA